jgi:hypothetical protein
VKKLEETLEGRFYPHLRLTEHVFTAETHISAIPFALSRGMRVLLAPGPES